MCLPLSIHNPETPLGVSRGLIFPLSGVYATIGQPRTRGYQMTEFIIFAGVFAVLGLLWLILTLDHWGPLHRAMLEMERWEQQEAERKSKGA